MTLILISTSWRHTGYNQPSGRLLVFDLNQYKTIKTCEIIEAPHREHDPNPRGGFRGLKGISIAGETIAIANSSTIFLYDKTWKPLKAIWHPICSGIHDIYLEEDRVWVTSSRNDLVFCFDLDGKLITYLDVREFKVFNNLSNNALKPFLSKKEIVRGKINFRDPRTHDHAITDRLHINSFTVLSNGEYLLSCGLLRIIDNLTLHKINNWLKRSPFSKLFFKIYQFNRKIFKKNVNLNFESTQISKKESVSMVLKLTKNLTIEDHFALEKCKVPSHSLRLLNDQESIYLNTSTGELIVFDPTNFSIISKTKIGEKFLRGAYVMNDHTVVLGDNNTLIHFDLIKKEVISRTVISENTAEAIFDVHVLPDSFKLPPESFVEHHHQYFPVNQEEERL